jgi:Uncharacterized conserved protein
VHQVHSNKLVFLNENSKLKKKIKADAIITNQKKLPIAVLTADCVPVLLYDYEKKLSRLSMLVGKVRIEG